MARVTASVRLCALSLSMMEFTWNLTVCSLTGKQVATRLHYLEILRPTDLGHLALWALAARQRRALDRPGRRRRPNPAQSPEDRGSTLLPPQPRRQERHCGLPLPLRLPTAGLASLFVGCCQNQDGWRIVRKESWMSTAFLDPQEPSQTTTSGVYTTRRRSVSSSQETCPATVRPGCCSNTAARPAR